MKWRRKKIPPVIAEPEMPEPEMPEPAKASAPAQSDGELTLEELIVATSNVMAAREAVGVLFYAIGEHRADGHDCPAYCTSEQFDGFLEAMDRDDLVMVLTVVLNDMVDNWLRQGESS